MYWIFLGPALLVLLALPALLPYRSLRLALRNSRHSDGVRSRSRSRREVRHAARFLGSSLLLPFLIFALLEAGLFLFHRYVVPNTVLHELFADNHPERALHALELESWYEAIDEAERQAAEEAQGIAEGTRRQRRRTPEEMLFQHWPLHLVFLIGPTVLFLWFLRRSYLPAARAYHLGVEKRHDHYRLKAALR